MCGCRDEGLLEPNGKTYMLSLKAYKMVGSPAAPGLSVTSHKKEIAGFT